MNERIAIIGAGELGQQIAHLGLKNNYHVVGFFDDVCTSNKVMGLPVYGTLNEIDAFAHTFDKLMIGIGYKHFDARKQLYLSLSTKYSFATIIDKSAHVDTTASIGEGCIIYPNVTIDKEVVIGCNVLLNLSCNICHNTYIGAHTYISPAVNIAGFVQIGECNFIGIGSTIIDNITISSNVVIGANSLVIKNLNANVGGVFAGVPIRKLLPKEQSCCLEQQVR
ncbi:MAG: NeuD/PglB/VioB family sugar acetyltransferase [Paludibacteraceae bacterium]